MNLLSFPFVPFSLALALLAALTLMEVIALLLGGSLLGSADAASPFDSSMEDMAQAFELDGDAIPDVDTLVATSERLQALSDQIESNLPGGLGGFLGLGHSPFMIWLGSVLLGFGVSGFMIQWLSIAVLGEPLHIPIAISSAVTLAIGFSRRFTRVFSQLIPRLETSATSSQFMGGLRGVVTQGTARSGCAAEVRVRDRHGNVHYVRCEPFTSTAVIAEGTEVLTVRERLGPGRWGLRILALE